MRAQDGRDVFMAFLERNLQRGPFEPVGGIHLGHTVGQEPLGHLQATVPSGGAERLVVIFGVGGHSLGSLLVLHTLFQKKPAFPHFLASAPSLWWADRAMLKHAKKLRARQATLPGKLFLGVGGKDSESMTGDLALLEKQLADKPFRKLEIASHRFAERDHYNSLLPGFEAGLKVLFGF